MPRPVDLPAPERFAHGSRSRYTGGCRCAPCRAANTAYTRARARAKVYGRTNRLLPVARVVRHLQALQRAGVGLPAIGAAAGVNDRTLAKILRGRRLHVREDTAKKILAVTDDAGSDRALVDAAPTWRLLNELIEEGYTRTDIARGLGCTATRPDLKIGKTQVRAETAVRVERLHRKLTR